jgi:maleamate amidohydrolase
MDLNLAEMEEVYEKQELGKYKIGFGSKPALIIIDFQYAFTDPKNSLGDGNIKNAVEETSRLLKIVRGTKIQVFYAVVAYKEAVDGGYFTKKIPALKRIVPGSRNAEIDQRLKPEKKDIIFYKSYQSSFAGTNFGSILTTLGIDTLLITGCATSGCVKATAGDAIAHGFRPIVIEECCGDRSLFAHEVSLIEMNAKVADVVHVEEVMKYIENL